MNKIRLGVLGFCLLIASAPHIALSAEETILINEIMWHGSEVNPEKDDWIELYNPGDEEVIITNWEIRGVTKGGAWIKITDEPNRAIQPRDYFIVSHYTNSSSSALEVRPQINKTSIAIPDEKPLDIEIRSPEGRVTDHAIVTSQVNEPNTYRSLERVWPIADGTLETSWMNSAGKINLKPSIQNTYATPKADNSSVPPPPSDPPSDSQSDPPSILINEILPNPKKKDGENEFIELKNIGAETIDLTGWELDDEETEDDRSYIFADEEKNYVLNPNEFMVLYSGETGISLGNEGDGLELFDDDGNQIDSYFYAPDLAGRSWGRNPQSTDEWSSFNHPTPGRDNIEANQPPVIQIREQGGTSGMTVNLTAEDSYDPDGDALTFLWTFEPGMTNDKKNPAEYTYNDQGVKTITLIVRDEFGLEANASHAFEAKLITTRRRQNENPLDKGGGPEVAEGPGDLPPSFPFQFLKIKSALPNPSGKDEGQETIILWNPQPEGLSLENWCLQNSGKKKHCLGAGDILVPQSDFVINEFNFNLKNKNDFLNLTDPAGNVIDTLKWENAEDDGMIFSQNFLEKGFRAQVLRVIDGDTFEAVWEGRKTNIRLLGVDTPETVHPKKEVERYGEEAHQYLKKQIQDRIVLIRLDQDQRDKYGRLLAYVYLDERFMNAELIEKGFAYAYTRFPFQYLDDFVALQEEAKQNHRGLWQNETVEEVVAKKIEEEKPKEKENIPLLEPAPDTDPGKEGLGEVENKQQKEKNPSANPEQSPPDKGDAGGSLCPFSSIKISRILPHPQKGEKVEYIQLINEGTEESCLDGWKLDDTPAKGSKPFDLTGVTLAPKTAHVFRQTETEIQLNDKDDCATLLDPTEKIADQICYKTTHINEIFTHAGGNWKNPSPRIGGATGGRKQTTKIKSPTRDPIAYKWDLPHQLAEGKIIGIDEKTGAMKIEYTETREFKIDPKQFNPEIAQQFIQKNQILAIEYREGEGEKMLMAIKPLEPPVAPNLKAQLREYEEIKSMPAEWIYGIALLIAASALSAIRLYPAWKKIKNKKQKSPSYIGGVRGGRKKKHSPYLRGKTRG